MEYPDSAPTATANAIMPNAFFIAVSPDKVQIQSSRT
jgi:hypothetical protein